ncbi:MAG: multicopper oxidase domain-containing protein [Pseudonocardiaceae bacterium]
MTGHRDDDPIRSPWPEDTFNVLRWRRRGGFRRNPGQWLAHCHNVHHAERSLKEPRGSDHIRHKSDYRA